MTKQEAYYSKQQDELYSHVYYEDENGKKIKVTSVGMKPNYPDVVSVGTVVKYLRGKITIPTLSFKYD